MRTLLLVPLLLFALACPTEPPEQVAHDAIAASKGFIEDQQQQHLAECQAQPTQPIPCQAINEAVAAQNLLIDALDIYCSDAAYVNDSGPCHPVPDAAPKLQEALSNLNQAMTHVKALIHKGGTP